MSYDIHEFYVQPLTNVYFEMAGALLLWTLLMLLLKGKAGKIVAVTGAVLALCLILFFTLARSSSGVREAPFLIPLNSIGRMETNDEMYRSMVMNVALFLSFGLSLPFALPSGWKHNALLTAAAGLILSAGIEVTQYIRCIGQCDVDDVLMNTIGVALGCLSYLLVRLVRRLKNKNAERKHR